MFGLSSLFGKWFGSSSEVDLGEYDVAPDLPHDYDEYQWWNPFDWAGNYDTSISAYEARKRQDIIKYLVIGAGLFGAYCLYRKLK